MTGDEKVSNLVAEAAGLDIHVLGEVAFARLVNAVMTRHGFTSPDEYAVALRQSPAGLQDLLEELVVPETWFFRDRGPFEFLRGWARTAAPGFLRVLSVPCSTGEEPYSIAITLLEAGLPPDRFSIDAVDISQRAIEHGVRAVYSRSSFRENWGRHQDYFTAVENRFALSKEIASLVQFHLDNFVHPSFLGDQKPYDLVFCRNLLIYLGAEARRAVLRNLGRLVAQDGVVVVGASELPAFIHDGYAPVPHQYSFACCKGRRAAAQLSPLPVSASPIREAAAPFTPGAVCPRREPSLDDVWRLADKGALEEASQVCDRLLTGAPAGPEHYYLKGLLSQALDRLDEAEDFFRKALYLNPDHYAALLHMSALYDCRGERSKSELFRTRAKRIAERGGELHESRY